MPSLRGDRWPKVARGRFSAERCEEDRGSEVAPSQTVSIELRPFGLGSELEDNGPTGSDLDLAKGCEQRRYGRGPSDIVNPQEVAVSHGPVGLRCRHPTLIIHAGTSCGPLPCSFDRSVSIRTPCSEMSIIQFGFPSAIVDNTSPVVIAVKESRKKLWDHWLVLCRQRSTSVRSQGGEQG